MLPQTPLKKKRPHMRTFRGRGPSWEGRYDLQVSVLLYNICQSKNKIGWPKQAICEPPANHNHTIQPTYFSRKNTPVQPWQNTRKHPPPQSQKVRQHAKARSSKNPSRASPKRRGLPANSITNSKPTKTSATNQRIYS